MFGKRQKPETLPDTVQQTIPFDRMWKDGICRVSEGYYTKTIAFEDINYQLATIGDRKSILEDWSSFLNFPPIHGSDRKRYVSCIVVSG